MRLECGWRLEPPKGMWVSLTLRQSLRVAVVGVAAGIAVAILLTRFLASQPYGVGATDPLTFLSVCVLLLTTANCC